MVHLRAKYFEKKMKKRLVIATVAVLVGLLLVVAVPRLITVNRYKPQITRILSEHSGLNVDIRGDISLTLLPDFGVSVHDITVSDPLLAGAKRHFSTQVDALILTLRVMPLLKGLLQFDSIEVIRPVVSVILFDEKEKKVADKMDMKLASTSASVEESSVSDDSSSETKNALQPVDHLLTIKDFRIHEGQIRLQRSDKGTPVALSHLEVRAALDDARSPFSIKGRMQYLGKEYAGSVEGKLAWEDHQYGADQLIFQLDDVKGYGKVDLDLRSSVPDIRVLLNLERLNLERFLSQEEDSKTSSGADELTPNAPASLSLWSKEPLSFAFLRAVNAHVNIDIGALHYKDLKLKNMAFNTHLGHGQLTSECKAGVMEGEFNTRLFIDATGAVPALENTLVLEQVDVSVIPVASAFRQYLTGVLNTSVGVKTTGISPFDWVAHMNGEGILNILHGKIKGVDITNMSKNITGSFQSVGKEDVATEFDKIHASFSIDQGIMHNDDLAINTKGVKFSGGGTLNIPQLTVNYRLVSKLGGGVSQDNLISIPILVKGSLLHPEFLPDVVSPVLDLVEDPDKAESLIHELKENLKDQKRNIKKELKQGLQNIIPNGF